MPLKPTVLALSIATALNLFSFEAKALESYFPSSIEGIEIPNAHAITDKLVRGNSPMLHLEDLTELEVTDVLIFKTPVRDDVEKEIVALKDMGFRANRIHHIEFRWKDIEDPIAACEQVFEGLKIMKRVADSRNRKLFFHCTVGEDRTGLLAGAYRVAEQNWSVDQSFREEMCARGYEAGNPQKPFHVVTSIREELTPLYLGVVALIEDAKASGRALSPQLCQNLQIENRYDQRRFTCKK